jgi:hypothetical protein
VVIVERKVPTEGAVGVSQKAVEGEHDWLDSEEEPESESIKWIA